MNSYNLEDQKEKKMSKFNSITEVAQEIFSNIYWEGMEAIVYEADEEGAYEVGYRNIGSFGDPDHESSILCTVELSSDKWSESLANWEIDESLLGTTDLPEELVTEFVNDAVVDHINYMIDMRYEYDEYIRKQ